MEGLITKYNISKVDGSKLDPRAKYLVLRYDRCAKDSEFLEACQDALISLCVKLAKIDKFELLAEDLFNAIENEQILAYESPCIDE